MHISKMVYILTASIPLQTTVASQQATHKNMLGEEHIWWKRIHKDEAENAISDESTYTITKQEMFHEVFHDIMMLTALSNNLAWQ